MRFYVKGQTCRMGYRGAWNRLGVSTLLANVVARNYSRLQEADEVSIVSWLSAAATSSRLRECSGAEQWGQTAH